MRERIIGMAVVMVLLGIVSLIGELIPDTIPTDVRVRDEFHYPIMDGYYKPGGPLDNRVYYIKYFTGEWTGVPLNARIPFGKKGTMAVKLNSVAVENRIAEGNQNLGGTRIRFFTEQGEIVRRTRDFSISILPDGKFSITCRAWEKAGGSQVLLPDSSKVGRWLWRNQMFMGGCGWSKLELAVRNSMDELVYDIEFFLYVHHGRYPSLEEVRDDTFFKSVGNPVTKKLERVVPLGSWQPGRIGYTSTDSSCIIEGYGKHRGDGPNHDGIICRVTYPPLRSGQ